MRLTVKLTAATLTAEVIGKLTTALSANLSASVTNETIAKLTDQKTNFSRRGQKPQLQPKTLAVAKNFSRAFSGKKNFSRRNQKL